MTKQEFINNEDPIYTRAYITNLIKQTFISDSLAGQLYCGRGLNISILESSAEEFKVSENFAIFSKTYKDLLENSRNLEDFLLEPIFSLIKQVNILVLEELKKAVIDNGNSTGIGILTLDSLKTISTSFTERTIINKNICDLLIRAIWPTEKPFGIFQEKEDMSYPYSTLLGSKLVRSDELPTNTIYTIPTCEDAQLINIPIKFWYAHNKSSHIITWNISTDPEIYINNKQDIKSLSFTFLPTIHTIIED